MSMGKAISVERGPQHQRVIHALGIVQGQFSSFWIGPTLLGGVKNTSSCLRSSRRSAACIIRTELNFPALLPLTLQKSKSILPQPSLQALFNKAKVGKFTISIDKALPHEVDTRILYGGNTKAEATILSQLRTGISRLNGYLGIIKAPPTLLCSCGREEENIDHYLFRCPRWQHFREELRRCAGSR